MGTGVSADRRHGRSRRGAYLGWIALVSAVRYLTLTGGSRQEAGGRRQEAGGRRQRQQAEAAGSARPTRHRVKIQGNRSWSGRWTVGGRWGGMAVVELEGRRWCERWEWSE